MRLRITFSKDGLLAYTSHLDLMRIWERSLRRAGAPLAYSQGFNPRPKLQLAAALPLGHLGEAELLDVWLERLTSVEAFAKALVPVLPDGLAVSEVRQVVLEEPALPAQVVSAEYWVTVESPAGAGVEANIGRFLAVTELLQEWRGKQYDLRPLVERLWLQEAMTDWVVLGIQLAARASATARAEAVLQALGLGEAFARYHRRRLLLEAT
ncbi:MAG: TIGR03936 family radical SAM-associated protein [Anaerolineae bacterium]